MTSETNVDRTIDYAFLLGGITAFIFGLILVIRQDAAIGIVALLIGLWWLIQGAFLIFSVFIDKTDMWWKLIIGLIGVSAGIVVLANPVEAGTFLGSAIAVVLGILGLIAGIMGLVGGFRGGGFGAILFGAVTIAISLLILFYPQDSFTAFITIVGIILMIEGVAAVVIAFMARPKTATAG